MSYFELAPWEKPAAIEGARGVVKFDSRFQRPPVYLDPEAYLRTFDRSGAVVAAVFANQQGLPVIGNYVGDVDKALARGDCVQWRLIGAVAAESEDMLPLAVARQRELIGAWAFELERDKKTDKRIFRRGFGAPPIRLAWAYPASTLKKMFIKSYQGELNEVPPSTPVMDVRCGFVGSQSRTLRSSLDDPSRGGYRFVKVELPN